MMDTDKEEQSSVLNYFANLISRLTSLKLSLITANASSTRNKLKMKKIMQTIIHRFGQLEHLSIEIDLFNFDSLVWLTVTDPVDVDENRSSSPLPLLQDNLRSLEIEVGLSGWSNNDCLIDYSRFSVFKSLTSLKISVNGGFYRGEIKLPVLPKLQRLHLSQIYDFVLLEQCVKLYSNSLLHLTLLFRKFDFCSSTSIRDNQDEYCKFLVEQIPKLDHLVSLEIPSLSSTDSSTNLHWMRMLSEKLKLVCPTIDIYFHLPYSR